MNTTPFTQEFVAEMKLELEEKLKRLSEDLTRISSEGRSGDDVRVLTPEYGDSEEDNAQEVTELGNVAPINDALEKERGDVHKALARIEEGTYGICKYCHEPIDERRLRARPTSNSCLNCKKTLRQEV